MRIECKNTEEVVKEAFWLAYSSRGGADGMGWFQARSDATKEDVYENVLNAGDYPGRPKIKMGEAYGDYVFGRMLKLGLKWGPTYVEFSDNKPRPDYQSWCHKYQTYEALVRKAIENVG